MAKKKRLRDSLGRYVKHRRQKLHTPKRDRKGRFVSKSPKKKTSKGKTKLDPLKLAVELQHFLEDEDSTVTVDVDETRTKWGETFHDYLISWRDGADPDDDEPWFDFISTALNHVLSPFYRKKAITRILATTEEYDPETKQYERYTDEWLTLKGFESFFDAIQALVPQVLAFALPGSGRRYRVAKIYALSFNVEAPTWYHHKGGDRETKRGKNRSRSQPQGVSGRNHHKGGKSEIQVAVFHGGSALSFDLAERCFDIEPAGDTWHWPERVD